MIIGNGMIARAFSKYKNSLDIIVFASGVSNSKEINKENFNREKNLLNNTISNNQDKLLVYFSTCSIEDNSQQDSQYIIHKKNMEELIEAKCKKYYIFRLPQVVGETHSPTLVNFLINAIKKNNFFYVQQYATRNLIDVNDVFYICNKLISEQKYINEITNIASPFNMKVIDIVHIIEAILGQKANFKFVSQGLEQKIDIAKIEFIGNNLFDKKYINKILNKRIKNV